MKAPVFTLVSCSDGLYGRGEFTREGVADSHYDTVSARCNRVVILELEKAGSDSRRW